MQGPLEAFLIFTIMILLFLVAYTTHDAFKFMHNNTTKFIVWGFILLSLSWGVPSLALTIFNDFFKANMDDRALVSRLALTGILVACVLLNIGFYQTRNQIHRYR